MHLSRIFPDILGRPGGETDTPSVNLSDIEPDSAARGRPGA